MSSSLCWKKVIIQEAKYLDDELKFILRKKYDGNWPVRLFSNDSNEMGYLEGLKDAGVKGAEELIEIIRENEQVDIYEEN